MFVSNKNFQFSDLLNYNKIFYGAEIKKMDHCQIDGIDELKSPHDIHHETNMK